MKKNIIIIGAGGNSKVVIDILLARNKMLSEENQIAGILDDNPSKKTFLSYNVLGKIDTIEEYKKDHYVINGIGNNTIRKKVNNKYNDINYYTAIHPTAVISPNTTIGAGTVIMANVVVNSGAIIGEHCIINTSSVVEHDNIIEDYVHLSPKAALAGNVTVKEGTHIGIGSSIIQGLTIGENTIIGAGAVVIEDITKDSVAVGVPAKVIKKRVK